MEGQRLPVFQKDEAVPVKDIELKQGRTSPPGLLSEADLIACMERHGIGTDASISVHINNICERNYVKIEAGRKVVPTELGITLIKGYQTIDPELCRPQVKHQHQELIFCDVTGQSLCREAAGIGGQGQSREGCYCPSCSESVPTEIQILRNPHLQNGCTL